MKKERLSVKELRDYINALDPKYDDASVAIMKPGMEKTILEGEIVCKSSLGIVLSPTIDKERQAMLTLCSREDMDKIETTYKQVRENDKKEN